MPSFAPVLRSQRNAASKVSMQEKYDYDVIIIGCGVGGHGAALHARGQGLKTAIFTAADVGGTCVNRGCVPSKALLAGISPSTHACTHTRTLKYTSSLQRKRESDATLVNYRG